MLASTAPFPSSAVFAAILEDGQLHDGRPGSTSAVRCWVLEQILPPGVVVVETFRDEPGVALFPEEEAVVARAVGKRRREFSSGRACARAALARLGVPPAPLLPGLRGAPRWPDG